MKNNVDLTMDNDFRKPIDHKIDSLNDLILGSSKFVWNSILNQIHSTYEFEERELLFTGNKEDRRQKNFYSDWNKTCDRCGIDLDDVPWKECGTLCNRCDEELEEIYNKIPWRQR